eukprot:scaffold15701_cov103-Skeletonema_dohrnii-CCMP3373.AAC.3
MTKSISTEDRESNVNSTRLRMQTGESRPKPFNWDVGNISRNDANKSASKLIPISGYLKYPVMPTTVES